MERGLNDWHVGSLGGCQTRYAYPGSSVASGRRHAPTVLGVLLCMMSRPVQVAMREGQHNLCECERLWTPEPVTCECLGYRVSRRVVRPGACAACIGGAPHLPVAPCVIEHVTWLEVHAAPLTPLSPEVRW